MRPITTIDFVARRSLPSAGVTMLLLAAGVLAWQGWLAWQDQRAMQHQRDAFAASTRQAEVPQKATSPAERRQIAQIEFVARHLAAPWDQLLAMFEKHGAGEVALVRIEPDASTGLVTLTARARDRRVMMAYVIALENDLRLSSVLLNHHETLGDVDGAPVLFAITAQWRAVSAQPAKAVSQEMVQ